MEVFTGLTDNVGPSNLKSKSNLFPTTMYLAGLNPKLECVFTRYNSLRSQPLFRQVPIVPASITGHCIYGHLITDEHRDHFRRLHPDIPDFQSADPKGLVSVASIINVDLGEGSDMASTSQVYDQGQWHTCLVYVDFRGPCRVYERRSTKKFKDDLEKALGITGKPSWYPRCRPSEFKRRIESNLFPTTMYLTGLNPKLECVFTRYNSLKSQPLFRQVPIIPASITGRCAYGHIITDEHINYFRQHNSDIPDFQSASPKGLVSVASIINVNPADGSNMARTSQVYNQGHWHTCLAYVDYRGPGRVYDQRSTKKFNDDLEKALGITGKPNWYPRYPGK